MKVSDSFKKAISTHLETVAANDPLFAESFKKENKNIYDCITYILNTVHKSGCNGFTDDEIFGMAMHYYDEDNIDVGNPISAKVIVNHTIELSDEEKKIAKEKAIEKIQEEQKEKLLKKSIKAKKEVKKEASLSLFD